MFVLGGTIYKMEKRSALKKTVDLIVYVLTPIVLLVQIIKDAYVITEFYEQYKALILIVFVILISLFIYYLYIIYQDQKKEKEEVSTVTTDKQDKVHRSFITNKIIITTLTIVGFFIIFLFASVKFPISGSHYLMLASHKKDKAFELANAINFTLQQNGFNDIKVKAFPSEAPNPYYSVIVVNAFSSFKEARKSFQSVSSYIDGYIAQDPQIISYYLFLPRIWKNLARLPLPEEEINIDILKKYKIDIYYLGTSDIAKQNALRMQSYLQKSNYVRSVAVVKKSSNFFNLVKAEYDNEIRYDAFREYAPASTLFHIINNKYADINLEFVGVGNETPRTITLLLNY